MIYPPNLNHEGQMNLLWGKGGKTPLASVTPYGLL